MTYIGLTTAKETLSLILLRLKKGHMRKKTQLDLGHFGLHARENISILLESQQWKTDGYL